MSCQYFWLEVEVGVHSLSTTPLRRKQIQYAKASNIIVINGFSSGKLSRVKTRA